MAKSYRPVERDQPFLLPPDMRSWLPQDHLVWFVISVVEELDMAAFDARSRRGGVGRAGFDPRMLVTVLIYSYARGRAILAADRVAVPHRCGLPSVAVPRTCPTTPRSPASASSTRCWPCVPDRGWASWARWPSTARIPTQRVVAAWAGRGDPDRGRPGTSTPKGRSLR